MDTVDEIKAAIAKLTREELATFRAWFAEFDEEAWDREMEEDAASGRLDQFADEAMKSWKARRAREDGEGQK
jgi:hypothetical protein